MRGIAPGALHEKDIFPERPPKNVRFHFTWLMFGKQVSRVSCRDDHDDMQISNW